MARGYFTFGIALSLVFSAPVTQAQTQSIDTPKLIGINLAQADRTQVLKHIQDLGGFLHDRNTAKHVNTDRFFTISNQRDSYWLEFHYNADGKIVSAARVYRRAGRSFHHEHQDLSTEDIAREFVNQYGEPSFVQRRVPPGLPSYRAFVWQTDSVTIRIDRKGGDTFAPILVTYKMKSVDPFAEKTPPPPQQGRRRI
jgi:hypothetical protein